MRFLPQVLHFKVAMYLSISIGLWPLISSENKMLKQLYETVSKLYYVYFNIFCVTEVIQLVVLLTADEVNYAEVTNNVGIFLVYLTSSVRCKVIKGKAIRKVIAEISDFEQKLRKEMDSGIMKIYKENVKRNSRFCILFSTNAILISIIYTIWPFLMEKQTVEVNNVTVEVKYLPISAWLPFDTQKHYVSAYILLLFNANFMSTMFFISTEVIAFGLMAYPIGRIRILKHILRNFNKYKESMRREFNLSPEVASESLLRECIFKHQGIISYVDVFNAEMKHTYLLDFLQCSLQLACILYRVLLQMNFALVMINLQFSFAMLIRLFITYWTANEVMLQSQSLSVELYNIEWLDESLKFKKLLLFMMMRVQRPLKFFIGVFKTMTLETFISIIKVTYSFISLFFSQK